MHQVETNHKPLLEVKHNQSNDNYSSDASAVPPPFTSVAAIPSNSISSRSTTNRTYLQCYSREANRNLVTWADQMSVALRDSVAHLDQICMRVRSCLSDLEENEIRYLHMQRKSSSMQFQEQSTLSNSLLQPCGIRRSEPDRTDEKEIEIAVEKAAEVEVAPSELPIDIESLPADTPIIVEPVTIQKTVVRSPSRNMQQRPKTRRGGNTPRGSAVSCSCSRPSSALNLTDRAKKPCPSSKKNVSPKSQKPGINLQEHLEMAKTTTNSTRHVYEQMFRNKLSSSSMTKTPIMRLPTAPLIARPKSILKAHNNSPTKSTSIAPVVGSLKNMLKNKENGKFNDSLWFKDKKLSQAAPTQCGYKVIVESPNRVPNFSHTRGTYNAQSRLQWIRAKNSLVLEYDKAQAAANNPATTPNDDGRPSVVIQRVPVDILDAINDDLVQPLRSEYPRKDSVSSTSSVRGGMKGKGEQIDRGEDGHALLKELLQDPGKLKGLVQASSPRNVLHHNTNILKYAQIHHPRPTPLIKLNSSQHTTPQHLSSTNVRLHQRLHNKQRKCQQRKLHKDQQKKNEMQHQVGDGAMRKSAGDIMVGKSSGGGSYVKMNGFKRKGAQGRRSTKDREIVRDNKENVMPKSGHPRVVNQKGYNTWSNMSALEIKSKLMPFLIPEEKVYTVLPVTEIIYDKKPPVPGIPPTSITKGNSSVHLASKQQSTANVPKRGKPRSLYTDVKTQRKLDAYLQLRDTTVQIKAVQPAVYTTLPAVTVTTPPTFSNTSNCCSARHSTHSHHTPRHPRRQSIQTTATSSSTSHIHRGTANPHHRRHSTASGTVSIAGSVQYGATDRSDAGSTGAEQQLGGGRVITGSGLTYGSVGWLDKAKRAKTALSAATRRDIGSSIQQLEDKIAELIKDPTKIGDGKAFDDVEQDIVRMLNKINTNQEESEAATNTDGLTQSQISARSNAEDSERKVKLTLSDVTLESAINLNDSPRLTDVPQTIKMTAEETSENQVIVRTEVPRFQKPHPIGDAASPKKISTVPFDAMEITAGLDRVGKILSPDQEIIMKLEPASFHKAHRKEPPMQPIYENIEPPNNSNKNSAKNNDISHVGLPRKVFKIENIPEYVSVDNLSQISDFPYVTTVKKQSKNKLDGGIASLSTPDVIKKPKKCGSNGKPDQELIVSTDNLCSIESDQFVTPFMKVVRKYRQEETQDNFMQFLDALTQLSQENGVVFSEAKLETKETSLPDLSNPFYNDMREAKMKPSSTQIGLSMSKPKLAPLKKTQSSAIEVMYVNTKTDVRNSHKKQSEETPKPNYFSQVMKKRHNTFLELVEYIHKYYVDRRLVLERTFQSRGFNYRKVTTWRGLVLRVFYTVFFAIVFIAMKWNWKCIS